MDGHNIDILSFNAYDSCSPCDIYVTMLDSCDYWIDQYGIYCRQVVIPDDASVYIEQNKIKCDQVILNSKELIQTMIPRLLGKYVENMSENEIEYYLPNLTKYNLIMIRSLYELYILKSPNTDIIILNTISQNLTSALYFEQKYKTDQIMLETVKRNSMMIMFIDQPFRTMEIMLEAVKNNGMAL